MPGETRSEGAASLGQRRDGRALAAQVGIAGEQAVSGFQKVIDARVELVLIVALGGGADKVVGCSAKIARYAVALEI